MSLWVCKDGFATDSETFLVMAWVPDWESRFTPTLRSVIPNFNIPSKINDWKRDPADRLKSVAECRKEVFVGRYSDIISASSKLAKTLAKVGKGNHHRVSRSRKPVTSLGFRWQLASLTKPPTQLFIRAHSLWNSGIIELWQE